MKKRITAIILLASLMISLSACSSSDNSTSDTDETEDTGTITTVTEGVLTVATSPDFAPYEFYAIGEDGTAELAGFDVALAGYIADYLGLELEIVTVDFDGVLSELQTKTVDIGIACLAPDEAREEIMDFSDVYYTGSQSLVTTADKADQFTTLEDTNSADVTIGAQTGSVQITLAQLYSEEADLISLPKVTDIITELLSGKVDAAYLETSVALCYQANYPDLEIVLEVPYDIEGAAVGVSKGNTALLDGVNEAIAAALADGSMDQFVTEANELATGDTYEGLLDEE